MHHGVSALHARACAPVSDVVYFSRARKRGGVLCCVVCGKIFVFVRVCAATFNYIVFFNRFDLLFPSIKRRMAGVKALILLAFAGCCGLLFLVLGCALPSYNNWWPLFVVVFYILSPIPLCIARRYQDDMSSSSACTEFALFMTTGIVVSAFGLPMILAHAPLGNPVIYWGACGFVLTGNVITFLTIAAYFYVHRDDDMTYGIF